MGQNHCWPSYQNLTETIEKPSMSMVNQWKNIQWWWFSGSKTIEKPLIAMVPSKKVITIPSLWKNYHRRSLGNLLPRGNIWGTTQGKPFLRRREINMIIWEIIIREINIIIWFSKFVICRVVQIETDQVCKVAGHGSNHGVPELGKL